MSDASFDRLKKIIAEHLNLDESKISKTSNLIDDLGADSLDQVELVMAIEETYGLEIADDAAEKILTVQDILDLLNETADA